MPAGLCSIIPVTWMTYSGRVWTAISCASGETSGLNTTWVRPQRSRMSMNIRPPCERRRCTHPASVTVWPALAGLSSPQLCVLNNFYSPPVRLQRRRAVTSSF